ncbi:hypothetical protein GGQ86_000391 [Xanthobacter flavus]|uniref:Uncharacterized protein n=1 Tax=Xanthobacter flavus TaxID=281 RepID=A0A9W6FPJ6_XANFL|nr:hypothetical protein [Xanthobacter flavus]MDR6331944.1 hypothetical protein [Xanthobacter flavus]GLI25622.1 hypothetical protein XFLAVUS301_52960 [Xanthobacter flavus]
MTLALAKSNCGATVNRSPIADLDDRRRTLGIALHALLSAAGVAARTWDYLRAGHVTPQRRTLVKLSRALDRLAGTAPAPAPAPKVVAAFYRAAALFLAHELGADPRLVLGDEGQSCPQDPAWLRASRARQAAFYLAHVELGVTHSALAVAVGTTKQRVHKAVNRIEDLRDDEGLDALLERTSAFLSGRQPPAVTSPPPRNGLPPAPGGTIGKGIVP